MILTFPTLHFMGLGLQQILHMNDKDLQNWYLIRNSHNVTLIYDPTMSIDCLIYIFDVSMHDLKHLSNL